MVRLILGVLFALWATSLRAEGEFSLQFQLAEPLDRPVVGQMIPVILRGQYDRHIANEALVIPPSDTFDWIQTKADEWFEERIDGKKWMVLKRHLALWPRKDGILQFGPAEHDLTIITRTGQREAARVKAEPLAISIAPHPDPALNGWKFAARAVEIIDDLSRDPARLPDGQTVTRRVTLRALGSLPEHLPPRPVISEPWLITFAAPIERKLERTPDGPLSSVTWEWQFRPEHGEPGVLEPIKIAWFDTVDRQMRIAEIPAITIGYASYYTGQMATGSFGLRVSLMLWGALALGLCCGAAFGYWHMGGAQISRLQSHLRRLDPTRWLRFVRAYRAGDFLTMRRLAEDLALSQSLRRSLDHRIYRRNGSPE